uniref:J domain-containing protein n=1 Tax=Glossina palpalis gambiensis TaxID=67801 RepID=A0A1B0BPJ3_9MUSC
MFAEQLSEINYYEILGVGTAAAEPQIRRNPGNPKATELFHHVTKALEILIGNDARKAFDEPIRSKELRWKQLENEGNKWRADLAQRERDEQILREMYEGLVHMIDDLVNEDDE